MEEEVRLIAAILNTANGSDPTPLGDAISQANTLLSGFNDKLPYPVTPSSPIGQATLSIASLLDQYNIGQLTPDCLH